MGTELRLKVVARSASPAPRAQGIPIRIGVATLSHSKQLQREGDAMGQPGKAITDLRKVWRMTDNAPLGEVVTVGSSGASPAAADLPAPEPADSPKPETVRYWRASSHDLATGVDVKDFSDTVSQEFLG